MEASDEGGAEKIEAIQLQYPVFPAMSFARIATWISHPLGADAFGLARSIHENIALGGSSLRSRFT
ncbi:hypothetical protein ACFOKF_22715 [Sphingobium rhizovicinum]|uniref:Uncharacterized protein n=1 Tax=Sphingobium rhizovicinum TaxID=432308 RepID=A0ABV7NLU2_9SPHN